MLFNEKFHPFNLESRSRALRRDVKTTIILIWVWNVSGEQDSFKMAHKNKKQKHRQIEKLLGG